MRLMFSTRASMSARRLVPCEHCAWARRLQEKSTALLKSRQKEHRLHTPLSPPAKPPPPPPSHPPTHLCNVVAQNVGEAQQGHSRQAVPGHRLQQARQVQRCLVVLHGHNVGGQGAWEGRRGGAEGCHAQVMGRVISKQGQIAPTEGLVHAVCQACSTQTQVTACSAAPPSSGALATLPVREVSR